MRASARARGYTARWDREAKRFKKANPLCVLCKAKGINRQAYAVDHIIPHKGDPVLMWNRDNWQSLCQDCHNRVKQNIETRGYSKDLGNDGYPLDPAHPANR